MADVFPKAASRPSARVHSYGSHDDHSFVKLGGVALKPNSVPVKNRFFKIKQYNPVGSPQSAFATANFTDIQITDMPHFVTEFCWIKLTLQDGGAGCTIPPSVLLLQRYELLVNGSSLEIERASGKNMYFTNLPQLERWDLEDIAPLMRMNPTTFGPGAAFAANEIADVYIPLHNSLFEQGLYLGGIKGQITIRLYWQGQSCMEAGNLPALTACTALISGYEHDAQTNKELMNRWQNNALSFRAHNDIEMNQSLTAVPSSLFVRKLDGVVGLIPQIYFGFQSTTQTGAARRTILDWIDSHELKDESGGSYTGGRKVTAVENRYWLSPKWYRGRMLSQIPLMNYAFGDDQYNVFKHRQVDGFFIGTSNDNLDIQTNASATGATNLLIMYKQSVLVTCDRGVFRVAKS